MWGSEGMVKLYGIHDEGVDILGGNRGPEPVPPEFRGRAGWRHQQEILEGLYFQGQVAYLSDKNFLEQYYKNEFDDGPNQETFAVRSRGTAATLGRGPRRGAARTAVGDRDAVAAAPRRYLIGQSFFDLFVYNAARASAGYALARPHRQSTRSRSCATDQNIDTGRFDLLQELSLPFSPGPGQARALRHARPDLLHRGPDRRRPGRVYGGGGVAGQPALLAALSKARPATCSTSTASTTRSCSGANYLYARSTIPYTQLPQLDRLNDDATDQALRDIRPAAAALQLRPTRRFLTTLGPAFDPQLYAIRRLVDNRIDTLDDIDVLQLDLRQRWQTKRGYPAIEHIVDWMTLDLGVATSRDADRDNFGEPFGLPRVRLALEHRRPHRPRQQRLVRPVRERARVLHVRERSSTARTARRSTSAIARSTRSTAGRCWARSATS